MAGLEYSRQEIEEVIDKIVERTMRMDMTWEWPCGVAYYGVCRAYEATKKVEYLNLVKARVDEYIELRLPNWTVNTCAMGHCLLSIYEATSEQKYLNVVCLFAHFVCLEQVDALMASNITLDAETTSYFRCLSYK